MKVACEGGCAEYRLYKAMILVQYFVKVFQGECGRCGSFCEMIRGQVINTGSTFYANYRSS